MASSFSNGGRSSRSGSVIEDVVREKEEISADTISIQISNLLDEFQVV